MYNNIDDYYDIKLLYDKMAMIILLILLLDNSSLMYELITYLRYLLSINNHLMYMLSPLLGLSLSIYCLSENKCSISTQNALSYPCKPICKAHHWRFHWRAKQSVVSTLAPKLGCYVFVWVHSFSYWYNRRVSFLPIALQQLYFPLKEKRRVYFNFLDD